MAPALFSAALVGCGGGGGAGSVPPDGPAPDLPRDSEMPGPDPDARFCPSDLGPGGDGPGQPSLDGVEPGAIRWTYYGVGGMGPVIGPDGTIYGDGGGTLVAVTPEGDLRWTSPLYYPETTCVAVGAKGTIYVTSWNGGIMAFGPDGEELGAVTFDGGMRSFKNWYSVSCPAIGPEDEAYVVTGFDDSKLYKYRGGNNDFSWRTEIEGACGECGVVISVDGVLYMPRYDSANARVEVVAVGRGYGYVRWEVPVAPGFWGFLVRADDGHVVAQEDEGPITEIDPAGCIVRVTPVVNPLGEMVAVPAAYVGAFGGFSTDWPGALRRVSREGALAWELPFDDPQAERARRLPLVGADGVIYFASENGWEFMPPLVVHAVGPDGVEAWRAELEYDGVGGGGWTMALAPDGTLYVFSNFRLYAIQTASPGLARDAPWPHTRHDNRGSSWAGAEP